METSISAAGWYPDPQGVPGQLRYWDGAAWTTHTAPGSSASVGPQSQAPSAAGSGKAVASLILGIIGLVAWFIPLFGLPISVTGLVLGVVSMKSLKRGLAIAGVILCVISLLLTLVNGGIGAYLGATGQHPLLNSL